MNTFQEIFERMIASYPGLLDDSEVNGPDLTEWISNEVFALSDDMKARLRVFAVHGSRVDE